MNSVNDGPKQQPSHTSGEPAAIMHYQSQQAALDYLHAVGVSERGIGLLYGPESSGKTTIIRQFVRSMPEDIPVAVFDGTGLNATGVLDAIRSQFGYEIASGPPADSLNELKNFITQKAYRIRQPLLIIENIDRMHPSALRILSLLAVLKLQGRFTIRMVLVSDKPSFSIIRAPAMRGLAVRTLVAFELKPMTSREATTYLYTKLHLSGCTNPVSVLPTDVCEKLHHISGGWPGILDKIVSRVIERARNRSVRHERTRPPGIQIASESSPNISAVSEVVGPEVPKLYLTLNRKTLQEFELKDSKILIGRSELCDVTISSRFVSKYHALLVRTENAMHLLDLKSTNGTFVNSRRVQSKVLRHADVISLGNHGIKLISSIHRTRAVADEQNLADTAKMQTLSDVRRLREDADAGIASTEKWGA